MAELKPAPTGYPIKLVFDRTPEILNSTGEPGDLFYGSFDGDRKRWLKKKLAEEVDEYLIDGTLDELSDILLAVEALAVEHGSSFDALVLTAKDDPRGGLLDGVMMYGRHDEFDDTEISS